MKEITITIPDNCKLVKQGNTYVIKEKDTKPKSWEEFCENFPVGIKECFIDSDSEILEGFSHGCKRTEVEDRVLCIDKKEAEAFLALMQLRQLRKAWVGDWNPTDNTKMFAWIEHSHHRYIPYVNYGTQECGRILSFPTKQMAEEFFECFRDLCETAKQLL